MSADDRRPGISSAPVSLPNAFSTTFLRLFDESDEPITGSEADMAGPWEIESVPSRGYGLFRTVSGRTAASCGAPHCREEYYSISKTG